jgi:hypothetical protein
MRRAWIAALVLAVLSACAASANPAAGTAGPDGELAGFWLGLWQGFIAPIAFVVSLFADRVGIYELHNTGGWYDFGYLIGLSVFFGGGGGGAARRRRR